MLKIKNTLVKNSLFSILQIVLSTLSYVVIYFLILHRLGKPELGVWSIITSLPIAISVFGSGVSGCVLRYIPVYNVKNDKKAFNEILFNGILFNVLFGGIIVVLGYFFSSEILRFLFSEKSLPLRYIPLFHLSLLTFYFNFISSVLLFAIDGLQLIYLRNKIVIYCAVLFCFIATFFIYYWDLKGILLAQLIQSVLLLLFAFAVIVKVQLFDVSFFKFNKIYFKLFLTYGQGFQAISISILIFEPLTKYFLNKYFNLSTVGIYDLVSRAVTQIRVLIVSAVQVITPLVSKNHEENELNIQDIYSKTIRGASLLSFVLFSSLICFGMIIISYLDKNNSNQYLFITLLLCISYYYNIIASTAYSILIGLGKLKNIIFSHFLLSILNILFFLLFGEHLLNSFIILPTALALIISSVYLIIIFEKKYNIKNESIEKSDLYIRIMSLFTIILTTFFVLFQFNFRILLILFLVHSIMLLNLIIKNDFFKTISNKILNR